MAATGPLGPVAAWAPACRGYRAPLRLGLDRRQRRRDRLLPAAGDQPAPPLAQAPQVGGDLPVVGQQRATVGLLGEQERLDHVGNRAADQPEVDPLRPG
jgi:hypothetical protein